MDKFSIADIKRFFVEDWPRLRWKIGVGAGLFCCFVAIFKIVSVKNFINHSVPGTGMILRNEVTKESGKTYYCPVMDYHISGSHTSIQFPACTTEVVYQDGETLKLFVDLGGTGKILIDSFYGLYFNVILWFLAGSIFSSLALMDYRYVYRLRYYGITIFAKCAGVSCFDRNKKRRPDFFFIEAVWEDPTTEKIYTFKSDGFKFDPSPLMKEGQVEILLDPKNPKHYKFNIDVAPVKLRSS